MPRRNPTVHLGSGAVALVAVALCATIGAAQQRPQQPDRMRDDLAGPVKSVETSISLPGNPTSFEPVEMSTYSKDGWLTSRVAYVNGKLAAQVAYRDTPQLRVVTSTSATGLGYGFRVTRLQPRDEVALPPAGSDGAFTFVAQRLFDSAGRLITEILYSGPEAKPDVGPLARLVYRYDDKGRLVERSRLYGKQGSPFDRETLTYDDHDHVVESVHYRLGNTMPTKRTYAYEYDERGNWNKRMTTELLAGAAVVTITTRKIAYY